MARSTYGSGRRRGRAVNAVWGILFVVLAAGLFCGTAFASAPDPEARVMPFPADAADDTSGSYLMPTDTEYITDADLAGFTAEELSLIRNEIYARHGYDFQTESIRAYFEAKDWYEPVPGLNASSFDVSVFNEYEAANIAVILAYEKSGRAAEAGSLEAAPAEEAPEDPGEQTDAGQEQSWLKRHKRKLLIGGAVLAGLVLLGYFGSEEKSSSSRSAGYSSYSSGGYSSGGYSSSGYGSSFDSPTRERTFTEGGPTGCGIGGSFCGCGSGR